MTISTQVGIACVTSGVHFSLKMLASDASMAKITIGREYKFASRHCEQSEAISQVFRKLFRH
jgi:hypothetical protein